MAKITIYLQRSLFPTGKEGEVLAAQRELPQDLVDEAFTQLDLPKEGGLPLVGLICTSPEVRERVMKARKDVATTVAYEIQQALLAAMGANDTEQGYPKQPT